MKRVLLYVGFPIVALIAAFLLPRHVLRGGIGYRLPPSPPTVVTPTATVGSLTIKARPARHAFLGSGDDLSVVYEITAGRNAGGTRRPVDFALVLDRSGSMTGEPLQKAKQAAIALVRRLDPSDRLALVHFGSDARLALHLTTMSEAGRTQAIHAIELIQADGGTNTSAALALAETALKEVPSAPRGLNVEEDREALRRIVLLSDGEANEGLVGQDLVEQVRQENHRGLHVSALGLGLDFDEELMMAMADAGAGQYRYLRDADEVSSALSAELAEAEATAATDISLALTAGEGVELRESPGVTPELSDHTWRLRLNDMAAGETRHVTIVVHARADADGDRPVLNARLSYTDVSTGAAVARAAQAEARAVATHDASAVARSYDTEAARIAVRARWGSTMMDAAREYRQDRADKASEKMREAVDRLKIEVRAGHDDQLAAELEAENGTAVRAMQAAPAASASGNSFLKTFATEARAASR